MVHWITDRLGTAPWGQIDDVSDLYCVDVRELLDGRGNPASAVKSKIDEALHHLRQGQKVVVCCDYGISRSNSVVAGIIAMQDGITLDQAVRRVTAATGEGSLKLEVLSVVRKALGTDSPETRSSDGNGPSILITGASGFIGSALLPALGNGDDLVTPSHLDVDLIRDVVGLDLLVKKHGVNMILHLANPRVYTTNESMGTAMTMLKNVLDVCAENGLFLIYLSGWEIYSGYRTQQLKASSSLPAFPGGTYGQTKFLSEMLVQHYERYRGVPSCILRSSPVYGAGSSRPKFIWNFLEKALNDQEIVTHKYLNGFPALDLLHVDDLVRAIVAAIKNRPRRAINLGTGVGTSTTEIARIIVERVKSRSRIRHLEIDAHVSNVIMDTADAAAMLGWRPTISLIEGLENLIQLEQPHRVRPTEAKREL